MQLGAAGRKLGTELAQLRVVPRSSGIPWKCGIGIIGQTKMCL